MIDRQNRLKRAPIHIYKPEERPLDKKLMEINALRRNKQYDEALALLTPLLRKEFFYFPVRMTYAGILEEKGQYDKALKEYQYIHSKVFNSKAYLSHAILLQKLGRPEDSIPLLNKVIGRSREIIEQERAIRVSQAYVSLAIAFREKKEPELARGTEYARLAIKMNPDNPSAHSVLAKCLADVGNYKGRDLCYERSRKLDNERFDRLHPTLSEQEKQRGKNVGNSDYRDIASFAGPRAAAVPPSASRVRQKPSAAAVAAGFVEIMRGRKVVPVKSRTQTNPLPVSKPKALEVSNSFQVLRNRDKPKQKMHEQKEEPAAKIKKQKKKKRNAQAQVNNAPAQPNNIQVHRSFSLFGLFASAKQVVEHTVEAGFKKCLRRR